MKENVLALLYALDDGQPHTQAEIARDWQIPKTTVNTNIKELKAAGYVAFLPSQAGREKALVLTEAGRAYARRVQRGCTKRSGPPWSGRWSGFPRSSWTPWTILPTVSVRS